MSNEQPEATLYETIRESKSITTPNLYVFVTEIAELVADGWRLDLVNAPPNSFGILYECGMFKNTKQPRKRNHAESLAIARAARTGPKLSAEKIVAGIASKEEQDASVIITKELEGKI